MSEGGLDGEPLSMVESGPGVTTGLANLRQVLECAAPAALFVATEAQAIDPRIYHPCGIQILLAASSL
jgi:hypothetical protein